MTFAEKRVDELTRAPKSSPEDAAPRIILSEGTAGATRIDVAESAAVRPGNPDKQHEDNPGGLPDPDITTEPDGTPVENPSGVDHD